MSDTTPDEFGDRHDTKNDKPEQSPPRQLDLPIDHGCHAHMTRAISAASAIRRGPSLRDRIERYCKSMGEHGCTRFEASQALGVPYSSTCGPMQALVTSGRLVETERTRLTKYGSPAAVVVSPLVRDPKNQGADDA